MTKTNFKNTNTKLIQASLLIAVIVTIGFTQAQTNAESNHVDDSCKKRVSDTMFAQSSIVDEKKAVTVSEKDPMFATKINGYKTELGGAFATYSIDYAKCDPSMDSINVVYFLKDSNGYVKTVIVTIDPSLTKVIDVKEYAATFYSSTNWSGYQLAGTTSLPAVYESSTTYTLPSVSKPIDITNPCRTDLGNEPCDLAIWTGLTSKFNPTGSDPIAQGGSDGKITCTSSTNCTTEYFLWYEFLPNPAVQCHSSSNPPVPGNTITSTVTSHAKTGGSAQEYHISVQSSNGFGCVNLGWFNFPSLSGPIVGNFIDERAQYNPPNLATLAKFGSNTMSGTMWYNGGSHQITTSGTTYVQTIMNNGQGDNISVGSISSGSFTQTYVRSAGT